MNSVDPLALETILGFATRLPLVRTCGETVKYPAWLVWLLPSVCKLWHKLLTDRRISPLRRIPLDRLHLMQRECFERAGRDGNTELFKLLVLSRASPIPTSILERTLEWTEPEPPAFTAMAMEFMMERCPAQAESVGRWLWDMQSQWWCVLNRGTYRGRDTGPLIRRWNLRVPPEILEKLGERTADLDWHSLRTVKPLDFLPTAYKLKRMPEWQHYAETLLAAGFGLPGDACQQIWSRRHVFRGREELECYLTWIHDRGLCSDPGSVWDYKSFYPACSDRRGALTRWQEPPSPAFIDYLSSKGIHPPHRR